MRLIVLTLLLMITLLPVAAHADARGQRIAAEARARQRAVAEMIATRIRHDLEGEII